MTDLLTPEQLADYTHLKQSLRQSRWLSENGITHRMRRDGTIAVTWTQINNSAVRTEQQPRWAEA